MDVSFNSLSHGCLLYSQLCASLSTSLKKVALLLYYLLQSFSVLQKCVHEGCMDLGPVQEHPLRSR